ncbi:AN1-type zinc finger protein 1-like [Ornithodoros turicata]
MHHSYLKMAELPQLGKHCHMKSCNRLDFLPYTCVHCKFTFCGDHRATDAHTCDKVENHTLTDEEVGKAKAERLFSCSLSSCSQWELTAVICPLCKQNFCLCHRHAQDHQCQSLDSEQDYMPRTTQLVQNILGSKKPAEKKATAEASPLALKVKLMKMKMHAAGDKNIPQAERVYFEVTLPRSYKMSRPYYFSKVWTVGRGIDSIAGIEKFLNNNNKADAKWLRLFDATTLEILPVNTRFQNLLTDLSINEGQNLILEYVERSCTCLPNDYLQK